MSIKENVFNDRKIRYQKINGFRNGYVTQHLTSVDMGNWFEQALKLLITSKSLYAII